MISRTLRSGRIRSVVRHATETATLVPDLDKPDASERLRLFILESGWHNCANAHLLHNEGFDGVHESCGDRLRKRLVDRFKKRLRITQSCEYPD